MKKFHPEDIILLRGNHETPDHRGVRELYFDLRNFGDDCVLDLANTTYTVFADLPYVVSTENGLLGLHGGLPDIRSVDDLILIPKGIQGFPDGGKGLQSGHQIASQIVWNDHVPNREPLIYGAGIYKEEGDSVRNHRREIGLFCLLFLFVVLLVFCSRLG